MVGAHSRAPSTNIEMDIADYQNQIRPLQQRIPGLEIVLAIKNGTPMSADAKISGLVRLYGRALAFQARPDQLSELLAHTLEVILVTIDYPEVRSLIQKIRDADSCCGG